MLVINIPSLMIKKQFSVKFLDPCEDKANVQQLVTTMFIIIVVLFVFGGALYYFIKNRKIKKQDIDNIKKK